MGRGSTVGPQRRARAQECWCHGILERREHRPLPHPSPTVVSQRRLDVPGGNKRPCEVLRKMKVVIKERESGAGRKAILE